MTDIFKSADWAREALEREAAVKRGPYLVYDPSKLTDEELAARRAECLRPGGLVFVGENPDDPQWSKADIEFLTGWDIIYGSRPVNIRVLP
jgi:hypothetical protein